MVLTRNSSRCLASPSLDPHCLLLQLGLQRRRCPCVRRACSSGMWSRQREASLPVSPDWTVNEDKWGAPVNESSSRKGAAGGGSVTSPRERPRIRNFLVCVFLAQVKWIAPISALRGQLHYMKETVTLNVMVQQPQSTPRLPGRQGDNNHPW